MTLKIFRIKVIKLTYNTFSVFAGVPSNPLFTAAPIMIKIKTRPWRYQ